MIARTLVLLAAGVLAPSLAHAQALFNDSHFHPTNYIQEGLTLPEVIAVMGDQVGRAILAPLPLQQTWDAFVSGDRAPDYYLRSDAPLYYYSFADAVTAVQYQALSPEDQARLDPMIVGFNPTDMYAGDHIRRTIETFPGVFTGIGEFSVHKEFVSAKVVGHTASLLNPALDEVLDTAGEIGLVVLIHCDINTIFAPNGPDAASTSHYDDLVALFRRHPDTEIIWAHTGLGRFGTAGTLFSAICTGGICPTWLCGACGFVNWLLIPVGLFEIVAGAMGLSNPKGAGAVMKIAAFVEMGSIVLGGLGSLIAGVLAFRTLSDPEVMAFYES